MSDSDDEIAQIAEWGRQVASGKQPSEWRRCTACGDTWPGSEYEQCMFLACRGEMRRLTEVEQAVAHVGGWNAVQELPL